MPDPVREGFGLREVVRAEEDRRLVRLADLADERLHLLLRARIEARRRLVQQQQDGRREQRPRQRDLLLHAAREVLHRLVAAVGGEADAVEDPRDLAARLLRRHAVVPRRVAEVLGRGHLLEERGLDRHAVDEPAHGARLRKTSCPKMVAEPPSCSSSVDEQADQRRLARAVLAEDGDRLAPLHREGDVLQRREAHAAAALAAAELLAQVVNFDCQHAVLLVRWNGGHGCTARTKPGGARGLMGQPRGATSRRPR